MTSALLLATALAAPGAEVVLSLRSGVAAPRALALTAAVADALRPAVDVAGPVDASACRGKLPCVLARGRADGATVLVTLEVGIAFSTATVLVSVLSVEEDGRRLARVELEGPLEGLDEGLRPLLQEKIVPALRSALGVGAPPLTAAPPPPPAPVAAPEPAPPPAVIVPASPQPAASTGPSGLRVAGVVVGAVGVIALGVGVGLGARALSERGVLAERCPSGAACTDPAAFTAWQSASQAQTLGAVAAALGGAALATGVLLFLLAPGEAPGSASAWLPRLSALMKF